MAKLHKIYGIALGNLKSYITDSFYRQKIIIQFALISILKVSIKIPFIDWIKK
ncbi:hypothetical protein SAMN02745912_00605 [Paramaledivibacter caminithermalis DSM 15212]|uniref:Uncharacterized protein n=1 Tax=Paramaledivibacter caminithermalis (strain DSM 15212 / CIP 107654 / DViRD3) TaxID=1121301 RepID=A0A1M6L1Y0_PARC5|nr:hypothetical protein SAMN02745912_00605 [Paramaledivibacter caminithermalis DSM 15212]